MITKTRVRRSTSLAGPLEVRADAELPPGVCGVAVGVAVVYGVIDSYGTRFRAGCLDRTKREKLAAGKVKLFADHDGRTRSHVGFVKSLETQGDREVMTAYLFDTEAGRAQKEYMAACMASGGYTGLSIGFYPRDTETVQVDGDTVYDFIEIELDEVSNTPRPAVPGADLMGVRTDDLTPTTDALRATLHVVVARLGIDIVRAELAARAPASNATPDDNADVTGRTPVDTRDADGTDSRDGSSAPSAGANTATMDERLTAVRRSYLSGTHA